MRTRIKEKYLNPAGFEPKTSGLDHRHSTNWATRPSWEQVSIRWPMSGQTQFDGAIGVAFDGALKVEVPAIEGTRGERTTAGLMPLGFFLSFFDGRLPHYLRLVRTILAGNLRSFSFYSPEFSWTLV